MWVKGGNDITSFAADITARGWNGVNFMGHAEPTAAFIRLTGYVLEPRLRGGVSPSFGHGQRAAPFSGDRSAVGKHLMIATGLIVLLVLLLPLTSFAGLFGFVRLPLLFYDWMGLIVTAYIGSAEAAKQWFYRRVRNK